MASRKEFPLVWTHSPYLWTVSPKYNKTNLQIKLAFFALNIFSIFGLSVTAYVLRVQFVVNKNKTHLPASMNVIASQAQDFMNGLYKTPALISYQACNSKSPFYQSSITGVLSFT